MRLIAFVAIAFALTACGESVPGEGAGQTDPLQDLATLTDDERRAFDARIDRESELAEQRRTRELAANRIVLDSLRPYPGAKFIRETLQGNDRDVPGTRAGDDEEYWLYVADTVEPYARYELLAADAWSTYRTYQLPDEASTNSAFDHYASILRDWRHSARDRLVSGDGHEIFADDYWRDGRCVWVHIGAADKPPVPPRSTVTVATQVEPAEQCVGS